MPTLSFRRHDPWWGVDGSAARARYRQQRYVTFLAFALSLSAIVGSGVLWAIHLGFAGMLGIEVPFSI